MLAIGLLIIGIFSRVIVHVPNFTPIIALSLFGGVYLKKKHALCMPLTLMIISDVIIGFHDTIPFTWASILLITLIGIWLKNHKKPGLILATGLSSSLLFFIITNFGAWLSLYPKTFEGFINCYVAAIPFFRNTVFSTAAYSFALFGIYEIVALRVKNTRFANVLLSA